MAHSILISLPTANIETFTVLGNPNLIDCIVKKFGNSYTKANKRIRYCEKQCNIKYIFTTNKPCHLANYKLNLQKPTYEKLHLSEGTWGEHADNYSQLQQAKYR